MSKRRLRSLRAVQSDPRIGQLLARVASLETELSQLRDPRRIQYVAPLQRVWLANGVQAIVSNFTGLEVKESDGAPDYTDVTVLTVEANGALSQQTSGEAVLNNATAAAGGLVSDATQYFKGDKSVLGKVASVTAASGALTALKLQAFDAAAAPLDYPRGNLLVGADNMDNSGYGLEFREQAVAPVYQSSVTGTPPAPINFAVYRPVTWGATSYSYTQGVTDVRTTWMGEYANGIVLTPPHDLAAGFGISLTDTGGGTGSNPYQVTITNTGVTRLNLLSGNLTIAAGSGIAVSALGSLITVAQSPAFSAKGDLLTYDGTSYQSLAVGTNGYVLTADSTQPNGIKWAAAGAGSGVTSLNSLTGALTLSAGSGIAITSFGSTITISSTGGGGGGVTSLNTLTGALTLSFPMGWTVSAFGSTISVAPPLTTKGDLLTYDGTSYQSLAVGTNGYVLTADSTQPNGIKWAAAGGGANSSYCILSSSGTSVASSSSTPVVLGSWTEVADPSNMHSPSTNPTRLTIPSAGGAYLVTGHAEFPSSPTGTRSLLLYRNGNLHKRVDAEANTNSAEGLNLTLLVQCMGGEYFELYALQNSGSTQMVTADFGCTRLDV